MKISVLTFLVAVFGLASVTKANNACDDKKTFLIEFVALSIRFAGTPALKSPYGQDRTIIVPVLYAGSAVTRRI